jgi:4-deoxy-L-threo-5-hexosulose-uronate ketol-isomerase
MQTEELRSAFLVDKLMNDDAIKLVYSHYDRVIVGGAKPLHQNYF